MKAPNIIEQLYFNKIEAQERTYRPDSKCFQLLEPDVDPTILVDGKHRL